MAMADNAAGTVMQEGRRGARPRPEPAPTGELRVEGLKAWYRGKEVLRGIDLVFPPRQVTAIIGPSGCGKSTLIRCLNRLHELVPGATLEGAVLLDGVNLYGPAIEPVVVRRKIGMVFQRPNPFPTMSIFDNVAAGLRLTRRIPPAELRSLVEQSLEEAALWEEVRDRLNEPATRLSGGQQQRLCIARALAVQPEVLLMDEPCSALDPASTARVEDLIERLHERYTIVIVTHNMQQAARVSRQTAFLLNGELVEAGPTDRLFTTPADERTEAYITGRFG